MFYFLLKIYARFAICIYCRQVIINKPHLLRSEGPLLLAANHPNSFLDGIIMTTLFRKGVHSLARGDAFRKGRVDRFLRSLFLLPVYRSSEGVENLGHNYTTFAACQQVFEKKGIVMIFSEGRCINEWRLRPLKKGTARLAMNAWASGVPLKVVPVGFNYSAFRRFGVVVHIHFGEEIQAQGIRAQPSEGKQFLAFNEQLEGQLQRLVYHIEPGDKQKVRRIFYPRIELLKVLILALPAGFGMVLHAPLYGAVKWYVNKHFDNDHHDSVVVSLLMLTYPFYAALFFIPAALLWGSFAAFAIAVLLPFSAWCYVQVKSG